MKRTAKAATALLLAAIGGCGGGESQEKAPVPLGQVPAAVVEAARKALPDVTFDSASKEVVGGKPSFEIKGKDKAGKPRRVEVARDGKVIGSE